MRPVFWWSPLSGRGPRSHIPQISATLVFSDLSRGGEMDLFSSFF